MLVLFFMLAMLFCFVFACSYLLGIAIMLPLAIVLCVGTIVLAASGSVAASACNWACRSKPAGRAAMARRRHKAGGVFQDFRWAILLPLLALPARADYVEWELTSEPNSYHPATITSELFTIQWEQFEDNDPFVFVFRSGLHAQDRDDPRRINDITWSIGWSDERTTYTGLDFVNDFDPAKAREVGILGDALRTWEYPQSELDQLWLTIDTIDWFRRLDGVGVYNATYGRPKLIPEPEQMLVGIVCLLLFRIPQ